MYLLTAKKDQTCGLFGLFLELVARLQAAGGKQPVQTKNARLIFSLFLLNQIASSTYVNKSSLCDKTTEVPALLDPKKQFSEENSY